MNLKNIAYLWVVVFISIITFANCTQTDNFNEPETDRSYQDLYNQFQDALKSSELTTDLQQKKEILYEKMGKWNWQTNLLTKSTADMSVDEQKDYLQNTLSSQAWQWVEKLQHSFASNSNDISIEQITEDSLLTENEKLMLIAILSGGNYLQNQVMAAQTKSAADCYAQYQKDCERALEIYAISGSVGAISGGVIGLAGATAVCALQLKWAEDDYKDCLEKQ